MQAGKLPPEVLTEILERISVKDPRVFLGPKNGEDATLIDCGDRYLVVTMDPITFATDLTGWYLVQVNANDIFVMGAIPKWLLATIILPEGIDQRVMTDIFDQLLEACEVQDITLVGGHTEVTHGISRPIVIGCMIGEVSKEKAVVKSSAREGDEIILTEGIAIEGTSLLAREAYEELMDKGVSKDILEQASQLLLDPGISVAKACAVARRFPDVHGMHDPTEGGLASALREVAGASELGVFIDYSKVNVIPECQIICDTLNLDPMGLISSGALLIIVSQGESLNLIEALSKEGVDAEQIGRLWPAENGIKMACGDDIFEIPNFERDELARYFSTK